MHPLYSSFLLAEGSNQTLFLDRDGVINQKIEGGYVRTADELIWIPRVWEALAYLSPYFRQIVLVTNQQGIGKGIMSEGDLQHLFALIRQQAALYDIRFSGMYFCPHLASAACNCRKPAVGMALQAQADCPNIDFTRSLMVGDSLSDIQFGKALGMSTLFLYNDRDRSGSALALADDAAPTLWDWVAQWKKL